MNPFLFPLKLPILYVLLGIYQILIFLHVPFALGFSIILLTVIIRLVLWPLTGAQLRASHKMQKIAPHLNKLKEKHKNDAKTLQAETMKLYKEHGVNPLAGCLPVIIQLPIIWGLYGLLNDIVKTKADVVLKNINSAIQLPFLKLKSPMDLSFFGLPLGQAPSHLLTSIGFLILLFPVVTALLQFFQSKMMFGVAKDLQDKKEEPKKEDFSSAMQTQSLYIFPAMIGFFSYSLPLGMSLYWNTFTIFGIIQQYKVQNGWGGAQEWIDKLKNLKFKV